MKYVPITYQQWLLANPDIQESGVEMCCPVCHDAPGRERENCEFCNGDGAVSITYIDYEEQVKRDRKQFTAHQLSLGMKQCVCGSWAKELFRARWSKHDLCRKCFEAMASEIREEAKEHDYDRHHKWGQGL